MTKEFKVENIHRGYYKDGVFILHSHDYPALINSSATSWIKHNQFHRKFSPAIITQDQVHYWLQNGELHREDGPAVTSEDGSVADEWWYKGQRHRIDGPAIIKKGEYEYWYVNGKRHRIDGPACMHHLYFYKDKDCKIKIIRPKAVELAWFQNDVMHRDDGPAITDGNGEILTFSSPELIFIGSFYIRGICIDNDVEEWRLRNNIPEKYHDWKPKHKILFKLTFSK